MGEEEKSIDEKIENLKQQREELWLKEGKAYRCKKCKGIAIESSPTDNWEKEGLCYDCWSKKVTKTKRKELMQTFKNAMIVDIEPQENPYSSIYDIEEIVLEVAGERYIIKAAEYGERYIEIEKV